MIKVNGYSFATEEFSNGEVSYKPALLSDTDEDIVELIFQSNKDLFDLFMAVSYLKDMNNGVNKRKTLIMYYVPYGRMDREIDGYVFSLKYFADYINKMHFDKIITMDNHSPHIVEMINNVVETPIYNDIISKVVEDFEPDYLFFPDAGAYKKYPEKIDGRIFDTHKFFYGEKRRQLDDTREIVSYKLQNNGLTLTGKKILIIDDICCTGGTVLRAANVMKQQGVSEISLFVAHCEANVIKHDIIRSNSPVSHIYTTDSLYREYNVPEIVVYHIDDFK